MTYDITPDERYTAAMESWDRLATAAGYARVLGGIYTHKYQRGTDTLIIKLGLDGRVLDATVNGRRPARIYNSLARGLRAYFIAEEASR